MTYEECRTLGHSWMFASRPRKEGNIATFDLRCARCEATRADVVSLTHGGLAARKYVYRSDYQYKKGDEVPSRDQFRLRLIAKLTKKGD